MSSSYVEVPSGVWHGEVLHSKGIIKRLAANPNLVLPQTEEVLYHYFQGNAVDRAFTSDDTANCMLLTSKRFIKLENKKVVEEAVRADIVKVEHEKHNVKYDKLIVSLKSGPPKSFGIWASDAALFFLRILDDAIPESQRFAPKQDHAQVPPLVRHGIEIETKLIHTNLRTKNRMTFLPGESIEYHYNQGPSSVVTQLDETVDCALLSNLRFMIVSNGKLAESHRLSHVADVRYLPQGAVSRDKINLIFFDGSSTETYILTQLPCRFFCRQIQKRIASRNRHLKELAQEVKLVTTRDKDFEDDGTFHLVWPTNPSLVLDVRPVFNDPSQSVIVLQPRTGAVSQKFKKDSQGYIVSCLPEYDEKRPSKDTNQIYAPAWFRPLKLRVSGKELRSSAKSTSTVDYVLSVKTECCGELECELSKVGAGSIVTLAKRVAPNALQQWKCKTDFEIFMDGLVIPVIERLGRFQSVRDREKTIKPSSPALPFDFNVGEFGYDCIIHVPGMFSAWRAEVPKGWVRFGDAFRTGYDLPEKPLLLAKENPAFDRPTGYQLLMKQVRDKQELYVWWPVAQAGSTALGCVFTTKNAPPSTEYVRCVPIRYLIPNTIQYRVYSDVAVDGKVSDNDLKGTQAIQSTTSAATPASPGAKALPPPDQPYRFSIWMSSSTHSSLLSFDHTQPKPLNILSPGGNWWRFPALPHEQKYIYRELLKDGNTLLTECLKALKRILDKAANTERSIVEAQKKKLSSAAKKATQVVQKLEQDKKNAADISTSASPTATTSRAPSASTTSQSQSRKEKGESDEDLFDDEEEMDEFAMEDVLPFDRIVELAEACDKLMQMDEMFAGKSSTPSPSLSFPAPPPTPTSSSSSSAAPTPTPTPTPATAAPTPTPTTPASSSSGKHTMAQDMENLGLGLELKEFRLAVNTCKLKLDDCRKLIQRFINFEFVRNAPQNPTAQQVENLVGRLVEAWPLLTMIPRASWEEQVTWGFQFDELKDPAVQPKIKAIMEMAPENVSTKMTDLIYESLSRVVKARVNGIATAIIDSNKAKRAEALAKAEEEKKKQQQQQQTQQQPQQAKPDDSKDNKDKKQQPTLKKEEEKKEDSKVEAPGVEKRPSISVSQTSGKPKKAASTTTKLLDQLNHLLTSDLPLIKAQCESVPAIATFLAKEYHNRISQFMTQVLTLSLNVVDVGKVIRWCSVTYIKNMELLQTPEGMILIKSDVVGWLDRFVEIYIRASKEKMVGWVASAIDNEKNRNVPVRDDSGTYTTNAPGDLFLDLNNGLNYAHDQFAIDGKGLVRVGMAYAHLLLYYIDSMHRYFSTARFEPQLVDAKNNMAFNIRLGEQLKPHTFFLAQQHNVSLFMKHTDAMRDKLMKILEDEKDDEKIDDTFGECRTNFLALGQHAVEILAHQIVKNMNSLLDTLFTDAWFDKPGTIMASIKETVDSYYSHIAPAILRDAYMEKLVTVTVTTLVTNYIKFFVRKSKDFLKKFDKSLPLIQADHKVLTDFFAGVDCVPAELLKQELEPMLFVSQFYECDEAELLKLVHKIIKRFTNTSILPAAVVQLLLDTRPKITKPTRASIVSQFSELVQLEAKRAAETKTNMVSEVVEGARLGSAPAAATSVFSVNKVYGDWYFSVDVLRGKGLLACDSNGKSDPYVKILLFSHPDANNKRFVLSCKQTARKDETLDPVWNESFTEFTQDHIGRAAVVGFEVWDYDRFADDDSMGYAEIELSRIRELMVSKIPADIPLTGKGPHPKVDIELPLKPLPGKADAKAAGSVSVSFSLYQKEIVQATPAPAPVVVPPSPSKPSPIPAAGGKKGPVSDKSDKSSAAPPPPPLQETKSMAVAPSEKDTADALTSLLAIDRPHSIGFGSAYTNPELQEFENFHNARSKALEQQRAEAARAKATQIRIEETPVREKTKQEAAKKKEVDEASGWTSATKELSDLLGLRK